MCKLLIKIIRKVQPVTSWHWIWHWFLREFNTTLGVILVSQYIQIEHYIKNNRKSILASLQLRWQVEINTIMHTSISEALINRSTIANRANSRKVNNIVQVTRVHCVFAYYYVWDKTVSSPSWTNTYNISKLIGYTESEKTRSWLMLWCSKALHVFIIS